jgi:plasmid stability protein
MHPKWVHNEGMADITMRDFPDDLKERLVAAAKRNRRSVNQEGIVWLTRGLDRFVALDADARVAKMAVAAGYAKRMRGGRVPKGAKAIRMIELGEAEA